MRVKYYNDGYLLVLKDCWKKYGINAYVSRYLYNLVEALYLKDYLGNEKYIIIKGGNYEIHN